MAAYSSFLWWKASTINLEEILIKYKANINSGDRELSQAAWIAAILETSQASADLNRSAAKWTAAAVLCSALLQLTTNMT
jgi:hypothetical protein